MPLAPVVDPDIPEQLLMVPGPTPVPEVVRAYGARPMINHRSPAFRELHDRVIPGLQAVFQTRHPVCIWPASGTGVLECAIVNLFSPGDRVLSLVMGAFGERFAEIAQAFGLKVERLEAPWGEGFDPEVVAARLREDMAAPGPHFAGVLCTFNETSTGVLLRLREIATHVRGHGALLLVDAISGLGGADLQTDAWGCDVVITGSQKALMIPPGLGMVSIGPRARAASEQARLPRAYWDWRPYLTMAEHGATPYTPAVSLWYALDASLRRMLAEGMPQVFERHLALRQVAREAFPQAGFPLMAAEQDASPTVTSVWLPQGVAFAALSAALAKRGATIAGGLGKLAGKMLRIGHMGGLGVADLVRFFVILDEVVAELGLRAPGQAGATAATAAARLGLH